MALSDKERSEMLAQKEFLETILADKATIEELSKVFRMLSSAMITINNVNTDNMCDAYLLALSGYSSWAIKKMLSNYLKGKTDSKDKRFLPSAPELSVHCDKLEMEVKKVFNILKNYLEMETYSQSKEKRRLELQLLIKTKEKLKLASA